MHYKRKFRDKAAFATPEPRGAEEILIQINYQPCYSLSSSHQKNLGHESKKVFYNSSEHPNRFRF